MCGRVVVFVPFFIGPVHSAPARSAVAFNVVRLKRKVRCLLGLELLQLILVSGCSYKGKLMECEESFFFFNQAYVKWEGK